MLGASSLWTRKRHQIIDTSAIVAIANDEPEAATFAELVEQAGRVAVSAPTWVEVGLVLGPQGRPLLDALLAAGVEVVAFDRVQSELAVAAHRRFGRGSGSPARLNLGDCFSYAVSVHTGRPLLFTRDDFTRTDVVPAR